MRLRTRTIRTQAQSASMVQAMEDVQTMQESPRPVLKRAPSSEWASDSPHSCSTSYSDILDQSDDGPCKRLRAQRTSSDAHTFDLCHARSSGSLHGSTTTNLRINQCGPPGAVLAPPEPAAHSISAPTPTSFTDLDHWFQRQVVHTPTSVFSQQPCLTPAARETIVEWMCDVVVTYGMQLETFLLAVNYMDRVLSTKTIPRRQYQLLGCACVWIAAKYEEVVPPSAEQVLEMALKAYTIKELVSMESQVMNCLEWNLACPTSLKFMHTFLVQAKVSSRGVLILAECLLQLACLDSQHCIHALPSRIAASALCVSLAAYDMTDRVPGVLLASRWNDSATLAAMSTSLYCRFTQLISNPHAPRNCIITSYHTRIQALSRSRQQDGALSQLMIPAAPTAQPTTTAMVNILPTAGCVVTRGTAAEGAKLAVAAMAALSRPPRPMSTTAVASTAIPAVPKQPPAVTTRSAAATTPSVAVSATAQVTASATATATSSASMAPGALSGAVPWRFVSLLSRG